MRVGATFPARASGQHRVSVALAVCAGVTAVIASIGNAAAQAQSFPFKPIRIASNSAAGNPGDIAVRVAAQKISAVFGQPVLVETRVGAGGKLAATDTIKGGPDGHSILFSSSSILISRYLLKDMTVDVQKDLAPVSVAVRADNNFMATHADLPVSSVRELVEYARKSPGKITYSSNGVGSSLHLQFLGVTLSGKVDMTNVPYASGNNSQRIADFLTGRTQAIIAPYTTLKAAADSGKVRLLAIIAAKRNPRAAEVPSILEEISGYQLLGTFWGFWVPAGTPSTAINRLSDEIQKSFLDREIVAKLDALDVQAGGSSPREFAAEVKEQIGFIEEFVKAAAIRPE
ncbi:MAG: Bug family tripartite tricarboxylate transporter substrate binding protein [Burkholderiales bacterium]